MGLSATSQGDKGSRKYPLLVYQLGKQLGLPSPVISRDGSRGACLVFEAGRSLVVCNNVRGKAYDGIGEKGPVFSADSACLAYAAKSRSAWTVVLDDRECKWYDSIWDPQFALAGKRLGYGAQHKGEWFIVVDGEEQIKFDGVNDLVFSPDGSRFAYWARQGNDKRIISGREAGQPYEGIPNKTLKFSPDSEHIAYTAKRDGKWYVVIDREEIGPWEGIARGGAVFSPDSGRAAFGALQQNGKMRCIVGEKPGREYDSAGFPLFSPNGERMVYYASEGKQQFVVENEQEGPRFDGVAADSFLFSPGGKRLAYVAKAGTKFCVVVDNVPGPEFDGIGHNIAFSPDEGRLAYIARSGNEQRLVVDHQIVRPHRNVADGCLAFTTDGKAAYVGEGLGGGLPFLWIGAEPFPEVYPSENWKPGYVLVGGNKARYLSWSKDAFWIIEASWE